MSNEVEIVYKDEFQLPGADFLESAKLKCQSQIKEAEAKIKLYLQHPAGVGEHPELTEEILKAAAAGADAQDILNFLEERW